VSGLYFDAFPAADPNGTALGELSEAYGKSYRAVHQAMGWGEFTINRHSAQAAWAATDNLIRVRRVAGGPFAYNSANYIGAFWIEQGDDALLSSDEEGGEELTRGGRTAEACLRWAVLYPDAFDARNDQFTTKTRIDGNWHINDRTGGEVFAIFLRDLDDRSPDPLPFVSKDFGVLQDSNNVDWTDTDTKWEFPVGTNLLDALGTLTSGDLFYRVTPAFLFHAYETEPGTDLSASITVAAAVDLEEAADRQVMARDTVSRVVVQGTKESGRLKYREVVNATVEAALPGRREGFVEYKRTPTNNKLDKAGRRYIRRHKRRHDGINTVKVLESTGQEAFLDYVPGDTIGVNIVGATTYRVYAIVLTEDDAGNVDPLLEFEQSPFDPAENRDADFGDGTSGNGGNGKDGGCETCPPYVPTLEPPTVYKVLVAASPWPGASGGILSATVEADGSTVMDLATCVANNGLIYTLPTPVTAQVWRIHLVVAWDTVFMPPTNFGHFLVLDADENDLAELEEICDRADASLAHGTYDVGISAEFHTRLARCTHNEAIAMLAQMFHGPVLASLAEAKKADGDVGRAGALEHRALVGAVRAREVNAARSIMQEHLARTARRLGADGK
jgi:hypothetical protein